VGSVRWVRQVSERPTTLGRLSTGRGDDLGAGAKEEVGSLDRFFAVRTHGD
jgi:hypothetical protein